MDYGILQGHLKTIWQLSSLPEWDTSGAGRIAMVVKHCRPGGKAVNVFTVLFISS